MKSRSLVLFFGYFLLKTARPSVARDSEYDLQGNQCSTHCFSACEPIINRFAEVQQAAVTKDKISELTIDNKNLQIKLSDANDSIKNSALNSHYQNEKIKEINKQLKEKDDQLKNQSKQLKNKIDIETTLTETVRSLQSQLIITEQIHKNITELAKEILNKDKQILELQMQIKVITDKTNTKTDDIQKQTDQIKQKSVQMTNIFNALAVSVPPTRWITIQRRWDGSENFNRRWEEYKNGFGNVQGEFFIGLEKLHIMTSAQPYELHIKVGKADRSIGYADYDDFQIGGENESYMLKNLGKYSGTAGDSLTYHKGMKFTTFDRDNDNKNTGNCASIEYGGWWFNNCAYSSLNGKYYSDGRCSIESQNGIIWASFHNYAWNISLTYVEMMIRPKFV